VRCNWFRGSTEGDGIVCGGWDKVNGWFVKGIVGK